MSGTKFSTYLIAKGNAIVNTGNTSTGTVDASGNPNVSGTVIGTAQTVHSFVELGTVGFSKVSSLIPGVGVVLSGAAITDSGINIGANISDGKPVQVSDIAGVASSTLAGAAGVLVLMGISGPIVVALGATALVAGGMQLYAGLTGWTTDVFGNPKEIPLTASQIRDVNSHLTTIDSSYVKPIEVKTIEIKNGDSTTRIEQVIDSKTGKVVQENTYERGLQDAPDGFKLVGAIDHQTGVGWAMNRETGKMEQVPVSAPWTLEPAPTTVFNPTTALPNSKSEYTITVQPGDTVSSIAAKLGMSTKEYSDFLKYEYGADADLNSIVAGRPLPIPKEVHDKLTGTDIDPTNPTGKNAVNGSDKQSDDAAAKREGDEAGQKWGDFGEDLTQTDTPIFTPIVATKDLPPDQVLTLAAADTDDGVVSDAGSGGYVAGVNTAIDAPNTIANSVIPATPVTAPTLNDLQNTALNDALAAAGLNLDGNNPITALPPVNGMVILANADGDIVGSIDVSNAGSGGTANLQIIGQPPQVVDRLGNSFDLDTSATMGTATGVLGLGNTLLGLANWDNASDLSHVQTVVSIYNQINGLANLGMPNMGGVGSVLSFLSACDSGDAGGIVYSGLQMVDTLTSSAGNLGMISAINPNIIPGLGMILALTNIEDNPLGVVTAALNFFPPAGPLIGAVLSIVQMIVTHAPISEGEAHASFDDAGNLIVTTDSEKHGGGGTANYWMEQLAKGAQMAGLQTPQAGAYTVGMPTVGYKYNPEGFNDQDKDGEQINGHLTLRWVDPNGVAHSRVYTADGNGALAWGDEKDNSIGEDFFLLMQDATKRYPPLAYEQIDGGVVQFDYGVATVVYATNTHKFDGMAEHTQGGDEDTDAAQDDNCYIFNSCTGNKYTGYGLKTPSKYGFIDVDAANDDVWGIAA